MNLSKRIYNLECFQHDLDFIIKKSVSALFPILVREQNSLFMNIDWNYLISCASVLAHSSDPNCQDAALRIAQCCLVDSDTLEDQKIASSVILHKLTNRPAVKLALEKNYLSEDFSSKIPLSLRIENTKRDIEHTIFSKDDKEIYLNKFQKEFYEKAQAVDHLSASAPTSSGKSFILNTFVLEKLRTGSTIKNIVYIVPTRALINQVEQDFSDELLENSINNVYISSVPQLAENYPINESALFIFTQERLHWFLNEQSNFKIDYLIIDEAHKINDGGRGILLQQKIEELVAKFPQLKILFCSPFSQNPEVLLEGLPTDSKKESITAEYVAVNQNLIWVSKINGKPKEWSVNLCLKNTSVPLGAIKLEKALSEKEKLPLFAYKLGSNEGGNMIYVNGQADAEDAAMKLYELVGNELENEDEQVDELINLTKKIIHPKYVLAKVLERKIAFHYGNMPLVIRKEIEKLYAEGHIKYLVCTSTLLEGVNLPARSIFVRKPKRGSGSKKQMSEPDFWNLAGRAGRLRKEFQGNIICIDPEEWENKPVREKKKFFIKRAITEISENKEALLDYIKKDTPRGSTNDKFEYAFSYYFNKFLKNGNLQSEPLDADYTEELELECKRVKEKVELPDEIIFRNPSISPLAQQELLNYFKAYDKDIKDLIPVLPEEDDAAKKHYVHIIGRISKTLSSESSKLSFYHAILVVSWMKGFPLARIINSNYKYWKEKKKLAQVIRETMTDIEEYVRFKFAKYSSCYIDILKHFLKDTRPDLLADIPQLNIWVEFGVSQRTQISLINLGLSRHTAIELAVYVNDRDLNTQDAAKWLVENDLSILKLPEAVKKEALKIKQNILRKNEK